MFLPHFAPEFLSHNKSPKTDKMVYRWMSRPIVFHCFLCMMTGGSGWSSSNFSWGNLLLFSCSQQPRPNAHLEVKESFSSCQFWGHSSQRTVQVQSLTILSCMQYGFTFFSSPRSTSKNIFIFCFLFLKLQCLLAYPHCFHHPMAPMDLDRGISLVEILLGLQLALRGEHCETWPFSHGYKADQSTHVPRDPINSYTQLASPLNLTTKSLYHSHGCCCSRRSVLAPPTMVFREPMFLQFKNSSNDSKLYSFLHEETTEACLPFLSSTKTSYSFSVAVIETC